MNASAQPELHERPTLAPEAEEVIARMPSWAARGLLYLILGFLFVALLWAWFGEIDVVVEARGALAPEGAVRPVQAAEGGAVLYVFVREGDRVRRGQPLVQLDATEARTRLGKLREEAIAASEQLRQLRASRGPVTETLEQESRVARLQSEVAAAELALKQRTISAPVDGLVTTLAARSPGLVLQSGAQIATIAPAGARLVAEARIANKDIAFVDRGLPAKVRLDAFPYQEYGALTGRVLDVSPDAVAGREAESFYKVTIALEQTSVTARGKSIPLRPGLALAADIVTERRRIASLLLEPFRQLKGRAQ